ncbi:MAG: hypothetical protein LQ340_001189 [Diploschistes diacapsis]|nr:MAG: hypothetical protein LQ340_001189 [Diploschistes diacapsis]
MADTQTQVPMIFTSISSSARQLLQVLRCIGFVSKAHVQITEAGIRFSVQESRVMQGKRPAIDLKHSLISIGFAFLQKELFSNYNYRPEAISSDQDGQEPPILQISLESLLETLQIFGINESKYPWSQELGFGGVTGALARGGPAAAFDNRVLGTAGICKLIYERTGSPLCVILEEAGITTTCELTIYEPEPLADIPFDKQALVQKIIMRSNLLHDAVTELSATSPTRVTMIASQASRYFALSSTGPHGSATVEFSTDPQLLETFDVSGKLVNTYKYSMLKAASRAMAMASKVSIRVDRQGVLSLQFLIELNTGVKSFVDFRYVPFLPEEGSDREEDEVEEPGDTEFPD